MELSEQEQLRRESLNGLRALGIEPYPAAAYQVTALSDNIKSTYQDDAPRREVTIAGRLMSRRIMGKASFVELQDSAGRIQIYITRDDISTDEEKTMPEVVRVMTSWAGSTCPRQLPQNIWPTSKQQPRY